MSRHGDDHLWPLVGLCAALAAVLLLAILASALAGLLGHGAPIWIGPSAAGTLLARLLTHVSIPRSRGRPPTAGTSPATPSCSWCWSSPCSP